MEQFNSILLIDDDFATNYLHKIFLHRIKITQNIHVANNGQHALELLFDQEARPKITPEIIFLDINMPLMDGWEFLIEYEKMAAPSSSKIIMVTASANPEDEKKGKDNPYVYQFLTKPLNEEKLKMVIESINKENPERSTA